MGYQHFHKENPFVRELLDKGFSYTTLYHLSWPQQTLTLESGLVLRLYHRGMLSITPAKHSSTNRSATVLSAGIYGDETGPIELMDALITRILKGQVQISHPCLFIFANPDAALKKVRFIEHNLNQMFEMTRMPARGVESAIAAKMKDVVALFFERSDPHYRWHLDLHHSQRPSQYPIFAIRPFTRHQSAEVDLALMGFSQVADIQAFLVCQHPDFTFSWYTSEYFQAKSLAIELGQGQTLGQNHLALFAGFVKGMEDLLTRDLTQVFIAKPHARMAVYQVIQEIRKHSSDLSFIAKQALINFEPLYLNQEYAIQGGVPMICESGRHALVFANQQVEIGQRAALLVEKVHTS